MNFNALSLLLVHKQVSRHALLLILLVSPLGACATGPKLKTEETFDPARVRAIVYDDICELQGYFDDGPAPLKISNETRVEGRKDGRLIGTMTVEVRDRSQLADLVAMLGRLYARLPDLSEATTLQVRIPYYADDGRRAIPIGAEPVLLLADKEVTLPYHPCIGAFFFGAEAYAARRAVQKDPKLPDMLP